MTKNRLPNLDKLHHVPVFAVRELLRTVLGEDAAISGRTGDELIGIADQTPDVTEQMVDDLFEDFRYGGKASFYIYKLHNIPQDVRVPDEPTWNATLQSIQASDEQDLNVAVCDIEVLEKGIVEIRYRYHTIHEYIEPENETPANVTELNFGFLWFNLGHHYMVIMSKAEKINSVLAQAVQTLCRCLTSPVRFPKGFVNTQFALEDIRRASWYDGQSGIRRSIAGDNLLDNAGQELRTQEQQSERTASLYREHVTPDLESSLGIHLRKGKLYLTRIIRASDLRHWMYSRLHPIILGLDSLSPAQAVQVSRIPLPHLSLSAKGEDFFREIVGGILTKQHREDAAVMLRTSTSEMLSSMRRYFIDPAPMFFCATCESISPICCPRCGSDDIRVYSSHLKCRDCGQELSGHRATIQCEVGHQSQLERPEAQIALYPKSNLQKAIADFINSETKARFNPDQEFFWIDSTELHYVRNTTQGELCPDDIEQFRALPLRGAITDRQWQDASDTVHNMQEKCKITLPDYQGQPRSVDCEQCYHQDLDRFCIPKLFRALDPTFTPVPHGGMEFGDVGLSLTIRGRQLVFVGIVKSSTAKTPIKHNTGLAKEILQQTVHQVLRDQRVEMFGVAVPRPLGEELRASIIMLANISGKPVVFLGPEELTRMYCALELN